MALSRDDEKPWKTDLARKSAARREQVLHEVEETVRKASSFEEALRQAAEVMKRRFGRFSAVTVYVADGEDLVVHTSLDRPSGPEVELDQARVYGPVDAAERPARVHGATGARGEGGDRPVRPGRERQHLPRGEAVLHGPLRAPLRGPLRHQTAPAEPT